MNNFRLKSKFMFGFYGRFIWTVLNVDFLFIDFVHIRASDTEMHCILTMQAF